MTVSGSMSRTGWTGRSLARHCEVSEMDLELDLGDPVEDLVFHLISHPDRDPIEHISPEPAGGGEVTLEIGHPSNGPLLRSISIEGFGPHDGPNVLGIDDGMTVIEGSNGSGKSHIIYALNWCLFGRPAVLDPWMGEEEDPTVLVNWKRGRRKGISVTVEFELNGERFRFVRTLKDGKGSFTVKTLVRGKWRKGPSPPYIDPGITPFYLFQGETAMFLSAEDPFSEKGVLHTLLHTMAGGRELETVGIRLEEARERCLEMGRKVGKKAERLRGKLEALRSRQRELRSALERSRERLEELSGDVDRTRQAYQGVIEKMSSSIGEDEIKVKMTRSAERLGRLKERLSEGWKRASITMIRPLAVRAHERAVSFREEESRRRMLFGAFEAQLSIVNEVIERETCICGAPIGRTGAGKKRLVHLKERLEEKKDETSLWQPGSMWTSDQFLSTASGLLGISGPGRDRMLDLLKRFERESRNLLMAEGERTEDGREMLVGAVRANERARVLLLEERERMSMLLKEQEELEERIRSTENALSAELGTSVGNADLAAIASLLARSLEWVEAVKADRTEALRKELEDISTEMFRRITGRGRVGVRIHRENFRIGVETDHDGFFHLSPLSRLSAGEREAAVLSLILALADILDITLVLDSPFSFMERGMGERVVDLLLERKRGAVVMVPTGGFPIEYGTGPGVSSVRGIRRLELVPGKRGSLLREVID